MHYVQKKNNFFLARLPIISANANYSPYNFQALANISGNFQKISINITFPENLQHYLISSGTAATKQMNLRSRHSF